MYACHFTHVEAIRDQFAGETSFLQLCETWGLNSGSPFYQQVSLPTEPSLQPNIEICSLGVGDQTQVPSISQVYIPPQFP